MSHGSDDNKATVDPSLLGQDRGVPPEELLLRHFCTARGELDEVQLMQRQVGRCRDLSAQR